MHFSNIYGTRSTLFGIQMSRYDHCYFQKLLNDAMFVFVYYPIKVLEEVKMNKIMVLS